MNYYILEGHEPVACHDITKFAKWYGQRFPNNRILAQTWITSSVMVSTVFLGIDHNWHPGFHPILFETMIFGGAHDQSYQARYHTWDEAMQGHSQVVLVASRSLKRRLRKRLKQTKRFQKKWSYIAP